ncbi:MAG: CYTH domain-containing protein, partial [Chloroflexi bacterium]|nr:CYTH domain-containing protein [Chloroflexota bacterium]
MNDSNQETEVKFYVSDLTEIEMRLHSLEAHLIQGRVREINLRFDNPSGDFQREGRVLRLRRDEAIRLTYKDSGQLLDGA